MCPLFSEKHPDVDVGLQLQPSVAASSLRLQHWAELLTKFDMFVH